MEKDMSQEILNKINMALEEWLYEKLNISKGKSLQENINFIHNNGYELRVPPYDAVKNGVFIYRRQLYKVDEFIDEFIFKCKLK